VQGLDERQHSRELELLRTARRDGKNHTQVIDEVAEMRLREDVPDSARPIEVPDCQHRPTDRQVYPYYRVYPTGDGYLCIGALNRALREKLCAVLEISDEHSAVDLGNISDTVYAAQKVLMRTIETRLQQQPTAYWQERLEAAGVPCGQVNYRANLYDDPQVRALDMMWELQNRELGPYKAPGHPIRFSKTPVAAGKGTPTLGENSDDLLLEIGYTRDQLAELRSAGVVK
jgi:crotonobetainyl-CoA:carnitine CoA-transferase CaiB-like acyl-CoA transferase